MIRIKNNNNDNYNNKLERYNNKDHNYMNNNYNNNDGDSDKNDTGRRYGLNLIYFRLLFLGFGKRVYK